MLDIPKTRISRHIHFAQFDGERPRRMHAARPRRTIVLAVMLAATVGSLCANECLAQIGRALPSAEYYRGVELLWRGEYERAEKQLEREARSGVRTAQSKWIDSICNYAMLGEVYYHQGRNAEALEQFGRACEQFLASPNWMLAVTFPPISAAPSAGRQLAPWGTPRRANVVYGQFPATMQISLGDHLTEQRLQQGGAIMQKQYWVIDVKEIVRCTALAISRRNELLGPLAKEDPLTTRLVAQLRRGVGPPNHWSGAWVDLMRGVAAVGAGENGEASKRLGQAVLAGGQFDHPLTADALIAQGRVAVRVGDLASAARLFEEAGYAAFYFDEYGAIDEALSLGAKVYLIAGGDGVYPPLETAIAWANRKNLRHLQARWSLLMAETLAARGQHAAADAILKGNVARILSKKDFRGSRLEAEGQYLTAWTAYELNRAKTGEKFLRSALSLGARTSLWNFQIELLDRQFDAGTLRPGPAADLYATLLRDPGPADWAGQPFEALCVLSTPHLGAFARWFDASLADKKPDEAIQITDRTKRHRFYSALPLGGRAFAIRNLLEADSRRLDGAESLQQQDLLARYPEYDQLLTESRTLRRVLSGKPLVPADAGETREQISQMKDWENRAEKREELLMRIALGRQAANNSFPPEFQLDTAKSHLQPGDAIVVFHAHGGQLLGVLITGDQHITWNIGPVSKVAPVVANFLQAIGNHDGTRAVDADVLASDAWRESSAELYTVLFKDARLALNDTKQLIIVPDDVLWYVPFEALVPDSGPDTPPLLARFTIRYAPFASLAVGRGEPKRRDLRTGVFVDKIFPRDDEATAQAAFANLAGAIPDAVELPVKSPVSPRLYAGLVDQLIVLGDVETDPAQPLAWSPLPKQGRRTVEPITDWLRAPIGGPDSIVLPGFRTVAETGLKRTTGANGNELFMALSTFFARGAQTALLSRWRTGGQTSVDLVREYAQESPHMPAADALQRAVFLAMESPINPPREPRVAAEDDTELTAKHPFFWAGYMLAGLGEPNEETLDDAINVGAANNAEPANNP